MHYLLFYDVVDDYITRRVPLRSAHLDHAQPFVERGELILGGALAGPADAAILLFQAASPAPARRARLPTYDPARACVDGPRDDRARPPAAHDRRDRHGDHRRRTFADLEDDLAEGDLLECVNAQIFDLLLLESGVRDRNGVGSDADGRKREQPGVIRRRGANRLRRVFRQTDRGAADNRAARVLYDPRDGAQSGLRQDRNYR